MVKSSWQAALRDSAKEGAMDCTDGDGRIEARVQVN